MGPDTKLEFYQEVDALHPMKSEKDMIKKRYVVSKLLVGLLISTCSAQHPAGYRFLVMESKQCQIKKSYQTLTRLHKPLHY